MVFVLSDDSCRQVWHEIHPVVLAALSGLASLPPVMALITGARHR
jgi:hypothetical protein